MPEPLIFQGNLAFLFSLTVKDGIIAYANGLDKIHETLF